MKLPTCIVHHVKCQVIANHVSDSGQLRTAPVTVYTYFDYWGKGTKVTVSSAQPSAPKSIFGLSQCSSDSEFLTIGCVTRGFFPADPLTFKWKDPAMKELTDFVQYPAFGSDGDYTKISHLRVKKSDWNPQKPYTCEAKNSKGTIETMINKASTGKGLPKIPADQKKFNITIYRPDIINKDIVSLVCEVTSPKPGDVSIVWKVGNEPYIEGKTNASILREDFTSLLSILTIPKEKYENPQTTITCAVKHPNMENTSAPFQVTTSQRNLPEPEKGFALNCNNDVLEEDEFRSLWSTAISFIFLFLFSLTYSAVLSLFKMKQ
ncbi:hypothetical protein ABG768_019588 [Culter alburnus]|uniref:Ig-like domain-containing protein n=1 Tax=Culter alburnus TaxID=194366 RepID=A0AAW2AVM3_CULAL